MKIIAEIMFEMYAQRPDKETNYPEGYFDVEKKLMDSFSKEQKNIFFEFETLLIQLIINEQVSAFEYILKLFNEPENFVE